MSAVANSTTCANVSVRPLLESKRSQPTSPQLQPNFRTGLVGEDRAFHFLSNLTWSILDRNWRSGQYELDIIAIDPTVDEVVFVEVKTRSSDEYGHPSQAVNWRKQRALRTAARLYLQKHRLDKDYRFDIICVLPRQIQHIKNSTW